MAELVVDTEAIKTELTETKLELDDANFKLSKANIEIQRLKRELRIKNELTSSSENISLNQERGLNIYEWI